MARSKLAARYSRHYYTSDVMSRELRTLSGDTLCCLPPPALDFRRPVLVDVRGRKLRFVGVSVPASNFEQDSVVFSRLGDVPAGMVVVVHLGVVRPPYSPPWEHSATVQMIGLAKPGERLFGL